MDTLMDVMADGVGEYSFASPEWVACARAEMSDLIAVHPLPDVSFTLCEVAHNAPVWMQSGDKLAWYLRIQDGSFEMGAEELGSDACDLKIEGDHSVLSNLARVVYEGNSAEATSAALARLSKLTRWRRSGEMPGHEGAQELLRRFHDAMAAKTLPRFVWMSPDWVEVARRFLTARAESEKYREGLRDIDFIFAEEFLDAPAYARADDAGGIAGFWVRCSAGELTVGAGALPAEMPVADFLTRGLYGACLPVGRTVEADMSEENKAAQKAYSRTAFSFDAGEVAPATQSSPSGRGNMPIELARVFAPLHDTISQRTSGELPCDYSKEDAPWGEPQSFDRLSGYDASWLRYDRVDLYGNDLS